MLNPVPRKPYPPFRIIGNIYYVGDDNLTAYLIATPEGSILINAPDTMLMTTRIPESIAALGFRVADVRVLLNTTNTTIMRPPSPS